MNKKICRKVNRRVRQLNKQIKEDVFKGRFYIREFSKQCVNDVHYFRYILIDKEQPERNTIIGRWFNEFELLNFNDLWIQMNDFIIKSDFWNK